MVSKALMAVAVAALAVAPAAAAPANPAASLSVAKSVRAGSASAKKNDLAGGGVIVAVIAAAAVVAGIEPRRDREIGVYQELQRVLPRRWVVDSTDGEHHVDGDTFSGGRRLGRWWRTPVGAANSKLKRGSAEWMH